MPSGVRAAKNLKRIVESAQAFRVERLNAGDIVHRNDGRVAFRAPVSGTYQVSMSATIQRTPTIYSNGGSHLKHTITETIRLERIKPPTPEQIEEALCSLGKRKVHHEE